MIQLLLVDDEPSVLKGLENRLRPWRREWQLRFAGSGDEVLRMLDDEPAEVVVSDMRMPGMDGAPLDRDWLARIGWLDRLEARERRHACPEAPP